jgi:parallel beta-helix repeat protein
LVPVSAWQGIRQASTSGQYLIAGTSGDDGLLYEGPISGVGGASYSVNYPGATSTSVYGPDLHDDGSIALVGSYKTGADVVNGFLFEGTTGDLGDASRYRTIDYAGAKYTYVHSVMGGLAVGNADGPEGDAPLGTGHAFLYAVEQGRFLQDVVYPGSTTTTAYGVWYNGNTSYTIAGGYSAPDATGAIRGHAYLVDYDSVTGEFSNWTSFDYPNGAAGQTFETHFEGISGVEKGVYTMSADSVQASPGGLVQGSLVSVVRNPDRTFGQPSWVDLNDPSGVGTITANSVAGNQVVGIANNGSGPTSVQATVNVDFQLSNVISGNRGNGVGVYGANDNRIAMNYIGTDATGVMARGNGQNGIRITQNAAGNLVGGSATSGNNPTAGVFVRPPQGNLISGNRQNGVYINDGATRNTLSGNFIGTSASGNVALGNGMDGVAIAHAYGNSLIGCTFQQDPFVYYNVISGNRGNGLRITNSNDTTVQANFMGVGANNATVVANGGDGMLISGTSNGVQNGGPIPLGGVFSGNDRNGVEVRDRASNVLTFNTFAGMHAFGGPAPNRGDGILITSSGPGNEILTTIASGNLGNGIQVGGDANGVVVTEVVAGTYTNGKTAMPNGLSGIKVSGRARNTLIGGYAPSVVVETLSSGNDGYGVEVVGSARDTAITNAFLGTNFDGTIPLGNARGGIYLGRGTQRTTIGGPDPADRVKIVFNGGNGLTIDTSRGNTITGNQIARSLGFGLYARGDSRGTVVSNNVIEANHSGNVDLTNATGVIYTA